MRTLVQEVSHLFPSEMLLRHNARERQYLDLYRVNVVTGESSLLFENNEFAWLVTDGRFRLRLSTKYGSDGSIDVFERRADGAWSAFMHVPLEDVESARILDFSEDGNITFPDEGHGFVRRENRLAFYAVVEAFLSKHLGGRHEAIGTGFEGSSIKVEAGAELVPGLRGA